MQEVLENAQKQAKEDKSKNMQKKRHNQNEIREQVREIAAVSDDVERKSLVEQKTSGPQISVAEQKTSDAEQKTTTVESKTGPEPKFRPAVPESLILELKEVSKLPEVDATLQTSPLNRQKLLTPSKFRNQTCASVAIQTETLK